MLLRDARDAPDDEQTRADIARGFEDAVVETLAVKCDARAGAHGPATRSSSPAASARTAPARAARRGRRGSAARSVYFPRPAFCTDNGAMIAFAGLLRLLAGETDEPVIRARARWPVASLEPPAVRAVEEQT